MSLRTIYTRVARSPLSAPARKVVRKLRERIHTTATLHRMERKIEPITLRVARDEPVRVNLLIPEINFNSFYGGYMAKFHLALRLARRGAKVRVVIVDFCEVDEKRWREMVKVYSGLEDVFDHIEVSYCFDRTKPLAVNPADGLIATTWWTAHIANAMLADLQRDDFLYMVQEYEPFTFPMGSWYALADASYEFPHRAIFSSELLRDYFRRESFGVFAPDTHGNTRDSLAFENAIVAFSGAEIASRQDDRNGRLRLLYYARPEPHAHRNMFETGYLALSRAVEAGAFPTDRWDLHGIGSGHGDMELPAGQTLKMIGKVGLDEYRATLLKYDLGLSLMFTPHPSLLPLEMAAAGMEVVSTQCLNKDAQSMSSICPAIDAARPTIAGVAQSLISAAQRVEDAASTDAAGSQPNHSDDLVNWSSSWDKTFDERTLERIETWIS